MVVLLPGIVSVMVNAARRGGRRGSRHRIRAVTVHGGGVVACVVMVPLVGVGASAHLLVADGIVLVGAGNRRYLEGREEKINVRASSEKWPVVDTGFATEGESKSRLTLKN